MLPANIDLSFLRGRTTQKRIAAIAAAGAFSGLLYGFIAPKWYESVLTVVPAKTQKSGVAGLLGGDLTGLAAGLDASLNPSADSARIAAVLQSIAVTDAAIEKFDLRERYGEKYIETAREDLWKHCDVKALSKPNLVQMTCEDKDPQFVQKLLTFFAEYGNQVFRRVSVSTASEEVRFLQKHVAELRERAEQTAAQMRDFEEKHQIVDLETQSKAVVSALALLESQRINKQLEFDFARTFSSRDEATLRQLESQIGVIDRKLQDLEDPAPVVAAKGSSSAGAMKAGKGMFPAASAVPKLRAEFETLYRDRKVAEATLVFALERLEAAAANEARDVSTFVVLDTPTIPTRKSRPKRLLILLLTTVLAVLGAMSWEWWRSLEPRPEAFTLRTAQSGGRRPGAIASRDGGAVS